MEENRDIKIRVSLEEAKNLHQIEPNRISRNGKC